MSVQILSDGSALVQFRAAPEFIAAAAHSGWPADVLALAVTSELAATYRGERILIETNPDGQALLSETLYVAPMPRRPS